jgi:hypothetical protein
MRIGPNVGAVLVLCSVWRGVELITDNYVSDLISSFLGGKKWSAAMLFTCLNAAGKKCNSILLRNATILMTTS